MYICTTSHAGGGVGARRSPAHIRAGLPLRRVRQRAQDPGQPKAAHDALTQTTPAAAPPAPLELPCAKVGQDPFFW